MSSLIAISPSRAATSDNKWHVIVMPYLAQDAPIDIRGYVGVFLYSYGFLEAVIDLNHNAIPDPGEPVINITSRDRLVYASIGYGSAYRNYYKIKHGDGPLWILVRRPVVASFIAYSARNGYMAAYTMPPQGKFFVTPGIPGNLYIAPATPGKTNISIMYPNGSVKRYVLNSNQYLLVNDKGQVLRIRANKPIAVVLANLNYNNNASYATELVPLEKEWVPGTVSPPFPESLIAKTLSTIGFSEIKSYLYIVDLNGTVSTREYTKPITIKLSDKSLKTAYLLVEAKKGNTYATDIVPVYNVANWWHVLGETSHVPFMVSFSLYTGYYGRVSLIDAIASEDSTSVWILADYNRDFKGDVASILRVHGSTGDHVLLVAPHGKRLNINMYSSNTRVQVYSIVANKDRGSLLARLIGVPIPVEAPGDYKPWDSYLRKYGPMSVKDLVTSISSIDLSSMGIGYSLTSHEEIQVRATITPSNGSCISYQVGVFLLGSNMIRIASKLQQGCKVELRTMIPSKTPPLLYVGGLVVKDSKMLLYPGYTVLVEEMAKQLPENVRPVYNPVYVRPGIYSAKLSPVRVHSYYSVSPIKMPSISQLLKSLGLATLPTTSPPRTTTSPVTTTKTTTTPITSTSTATTTTSKPTTTQRTTTTTHKPARTTQTTISGATKTSSETTTTLEEKAQTMIKEGDTITYTVTVSGSGPAGSASGSGEIILKAIMKNKQLGLRVEKNTLSKTAAALLLLANPVSDLFLVAASAQTGKTLYYTLPSYTPPTAAKCPVISPSKDSRTISGEFNMMYNYKYKCTYSKGILVSAETEISGSVAGKSFNVKAKAYLKDTSIKGIEKAKKESTKFPISLLALIGAVIVIVVIGLLLARRKS